MLDKILYVVDFPQVTPRNLKEVQTIRVDKERVHLFFFISLCVVVFLVRSVIFQNA